jgi:hypothetical protein
MDGEYVCDADLEGRYLRLLNSRAEPVLAALAERAVVCELGDPATGTSRRVRLVPPKLRPGEGLADRRLLVVDGG